MLSDGVDLIYLEDLKPGWPDEAWLVDFCRERKLEMEARQIRSSPYISTEGSFDEYRQTLSRNFRKVISNRLNRIERAGGFEIKSYSDSESIEQALCDVEEISKNSWQGKAGSGLFSTDANKQFYMNLIKHAFEHQYGTLFVLQIENQPAAFEFHLFHEETEYCLKSEYAARFEEVSPGTVLYYELLKRAFESPVKIYD